MLPIMPDVRFFPETDLVRQRFNGFTWFFKEKAVNLLASKTIF